MKIIFFIIKFLPYFLLGFYIIKSIIKYRTDKELDGEDIIDILSAIVISIFYSITFIHLQISYNNESIYRENAFIIDFVKPIASIAIGVIWTILSGYYSYLILDKEKTIQSIGIAAIITFAIPFFVLISNSIGY